MDITVHCFTEKNGKKMKKLKKSTRNICKSNKRKDGLTTKDILNKCIIKAGNIVRLAEHTGLSRVTIYSILNDNDCTIATDLRLKEYLENG